MNTPEEPENRFSFTFCHVKPPAPKPSPWRYLWFPAALLAAVILSLIIRAILLTL